MGIAGGCGAAMGIASVCRGAMGIAGGLWRVETIGRNRSEKCLILLNNSFNFIE
jgi:hypothetical protein